MSAIRHSLNVVLFGSLTLISLSAQVQQYPHAHAHHAHQKAHVVVDAEGDSKVLVGDSKAVDTAPFRQGTNGSTPSGWIQVGTPKKWLLVIFDTGSDKLVAKTWETVATELASIDQGVSGMVIPSGLIYDHNSSSSYHRKYVKDPDSGKQIPRQSQITYGSGTAITDDGEDKVLVGNRNLENFTVMEITADSLQLLHTSSGIAGILGLQHMKNKSLGNSLFSQMRDHDLLTSFGYCRGTGDNGTFIWADQSTEGHELDVIGQMHWAVKLSGIEVPRQNASSASLIQKRDRAEAKEVRWSGVNDDGDTGGEESDEDKAIDELEKELKDMEKELSGEKRQYAKDDSVTLKQACPDGKCTAILDTGSNILAGPSAAMESISNMVNVKPDCSNFDSLPDIHMTLGDMQVSIPPSGYVMKMPMPSQSEMGGGDGEMGDEEESEEPMDGGDGDGDLDGEADLAMAREASVRNLLPLQNAAPHNGRRHEMGLTEKRALSFHDKTNRRWKAVFERLHRTSGIDLRESVAALIRQHNNTGNGEFMCMAALVPLDKSTAFGPLWIVGTPMMDAYYTRFSWSKEDSSPKVHLKALEEADVCKQDGQTVVPTAGLLRSEKVPSDNKQAHKSKRGPTERLPKEIRYPHWAKELLHV